jgi:hypothetical protein
MAKNLTGKILQAKDDAAELSGIFGQLKAQMSSFEFDPKKSVENTKKNFREIVDIAEKFSQYQHSIAEGGMKNANLSAQQLSDLKKQYKQAKENLVLNQRGIEQRLSGLRQEQMLLAKQTNLTQKQIEQFKNLGKEISENVKLQAQLKQVLEDSDKSMRKFEKSLDRAVKVSKGLETADKALGGMQKMVSMIPFASWLNPLTAIANIINIIFNTIKEVDEQTGKAAKSLNRSYQETASMRMSMANVARSTKTIYDNSRDMLEVFTDLNAAMGLTQNFKEMTREEQKGVAFLGKMYKYAGLTLEETTGLAKYAYLQRRDVEKMSSDMMAQYKVTGLRYKVVLNEKDVLKDIAKTSEFFKLTIEGGATGLAQALATTKALGTSLESVNSTAKGLLNFEDSIEKELSAELILGKEINGEYMRTLAFNNQHAKLAEEIKKTLGDSSFFTQNNAIGVQTMADYLNISAEEMAKIVASQETMVNASQSSLSAEQARYQSLVAAHGEQGAMAMIALQQLDSQNKQASVAEHIDALMQNLVDKHLPGIYAALEMVREWATKFFNALDKITGSFDLIKEAIAIAAGLIAGTLVFQATLFLAKLYYQVKAIYDQKKAQESVNATLEKQLSLMERIAGQSAIINTSTKNTSNTSKQQVQYEYQISGQKQTQSISSKAQEMSTRSTVTAEQQKTGTLVTNDVLSKSTAISTMTSAAAASVGTAIPIILAALGTAMAAYSAYSSVKSAMNDGVIGPGGDRVLLGAPGGPISFNKKDTIVAGTNLMNDGVVYGAEGSLSLGGGSAGLREEIQSLKAAIIELASRPINVTATANGKNIVELKGAFPNEDGLTSAQNAYQIS